MTSYQEAVTSLKNSDHSIDEIWAAMAAAYRVNDGYVKSTIESYTSTFNNEFVPGHYANKLIAANYFTPIDGINGIPSIEITDEDHATASTVREMIRALSFKALRSGQLSGFEHNLSQLGDLETAKINTRDFGLMAYSILWGLNEERRCRVELESHQSNPVGTVGERMRGLAVTVRNVIHSQRWLRYFVVAATAEGDLIRFALNKEYKVGDQLVIDGTPTEGFDNNITKFNRVKVKSCA